MKVGIDYGNTISKYPEIFKKISEWHRASGDTIYIVPGRNYKYFSGDNIEQQVIDTYNKALDEKGILYDIIAPHDDRKHTDDDKWKGKYCDKEKIDLFYDDNDGYIEDIKRWSPNTKIIKIT